MSQQGKVRIGHRAPDFQCDAVSKGLIEEVTLSTYFNETKHKWLVLLFIPAAFSFVCPTEVLAFHNCLDEFSDRNCEIIFVSVDTKHSLWHWQNVPRRYGGLGQIGITLLSDVTHKMSRDYGVLIEEEGICLRGMFILDADAIVQQVTINNLTVSRSVLEALRLLEALQAVAIHGSLCPVEMQPTINATDANDTTFNEVTEAYEDRAANLHGEFGHTVVTDLDAKHKRETEVEAQKVDGRHNESVRRSSTSSSQPESTIGSVCTTSLRSHSNASGSSSGERNCKILLKSAQDGLSRGSRTSTRSTNSMSSYFSRKSTYSCRSSKAMSAPTSASITPVPTPSRTELPPQRKLPTRTNIMTTAKLSQDDSTSSQSISPLSQKRSLLSVGKHNTFESRRGSHVVLEFADPTAFGQISPRLVPSMKAPAYPRSGRASTAASPAPTPHAVTPGIAATTVATPAGQTRLQATFEAIKKMSAGLASPRIDFSSKRSAEEAVKSPGYFDVVADGQ